MDGILLTWVSNDNRSDEYTIHRDPGEGFGEGEVPWVTVDGSTRSYLDANVTVGVTYSYQVNPGAIKLFTPAEGCPPVSATAIPPETELPPEPELPPETEIPFFPTTGGLALAALGAIGAAGVILARRRE